MKILYVHKIFGAQGGAESNILHTARELGRRNHQVAILYSDTAEGKCREWQDVFPEAYPIHQAADPEKSIRSCVDDFKPDIIYMHKLNDSRILRTLLQTGIPIARMVHDHDLYCMRGSKYSYFTRRPCPRPMTPYCAFPCSSFIVRDRNGRLPLRWVSYKEKIEHLRMNRQIHQLIVPSDYIRKELIQNGLDPHKIKKHCPIPPPKTAIPEPSTGLRNRIVFMGQILRGKGVDLLLKSLARLAVPFECLIIGEGSHKAYCQRLTKRLGLTDRVSFTGYLSQSELHDRLNEASVLAVTSVWPEPFATVGIEAMRLAIPVVAFDVGGITEWLQDGVNGLLVPWKDDRTYAIQLERLLRDKALARRLGQNAFHAAQSQFDFSSYIARLEATLSNVAFEAALH